MKLLIKNAQILTMDADGSVLDNSCVGINGNKIDYVGKFSDKLTGKYDEVMDVHGKAVMPGFVNAHTHVSMTIFRNYADDLKLMDWLFKKIFPLEDKLTAEQAYVSSSLSALEMIRAGVTTFADMYFFMDQTAEVVKKSGMRAALARGLQGEETGIDQRIKENLELYKNYNGFDGRIKVMLGPHAVYTSSKEYLTTVKEVSEKYNIPVHIHVSETKDEVQNCIKKYGMSPVKLLDSIGILNENTVAAHLVVVDDDDVEILKKRRVNVVHNPESNLKLGSGIAPICRFLKEGINVCLGTDGASSNNNLDILKEARFASYIQKGVNEDPTALKVDEVLKMATVNGAKALGFQNLGQIKKGMYADIIVVDTNKCNYYPKYNVKSALLYSGNSSDVETVIINGNMVMKNNEILTLDEEKILYDMEKLKMK